MTIQAFNLSPEASQEIITKASAISGFQQAAKRMNLPGNGVQTPVLGEASASWVAAGAQKPESVVETSSVVIEPYTVSTIVIAQKQEIEDLALLEEKIISEGVSALARKFDTTVAGFAAAPGSNFATFANSSVVAVTDLKTFGDALISATASGKAATSIVLNNSLLLQLQFATSGKTDAPVFRVDTATQTINGIRYYVANFDSTVNEPFGVVGAFEECARWGTVSGIDVRISEEASVGGLNFFERNLVGIRVEARYGFQVTDSSAFVKITESDNGEDEGSDN